MSDTSTERIDVDAIMAEIRENIKTRGYKPAQLSFKDIISSAEMTEDKAKQMAESYDVIAHARQIQYMEEYCDIDYIREIKGNKIKVFFKKAIRRLISAALLPIVDDINAYHSAVLEAELQNYNSINARDREREELLERIKVLEERIEQLENK